MNLLTTLQALNACFGPSGQEQSVARKIADYAKPYADEVYTDTLGNLIVHKKGPGAKLMFSAHMDSVGLMVTHIEKNGFLRVGNIGYIDPLTAQGTPVRFKSGALALVDRDEGVKADAVKLDDLFLDVGAADREAAAKIVSLGDAAVYATPTARAGEAIISPYLDDRISCVTLLAVLERLKESPNDLWFAFTVQEEVGVRGAQTAAYAIAPDYAVAVDVTPAGDQPGSKHQFSSRCGGGTAVKVMDGSVICHPQMVKLLEGLAKAGGIPYQLDVITGGGTDAGAIHKSRAGVITGGVSIPCRYTHSPAELVYESDVLAAIDLLTALCEETLGAVPAVRV